MRKLKLMQHMGILILCAVFLFGIAGFMNTGKAEEIHHNITHYKPINSWKKH